MQYTMPLIIPHFIVMVVCKWCEEWNPWEQKPCKFMVDSLQVGPTRLLWDSIMILLELNEFYLQRPCYIQFIALQPSNLINLARLIMGNNMGICIVWLTYCNPIVWPTIQIIMHEVSVQYQLNLNRQILTMLPLFHSQLWIRLHLTTIKNMNLKHIKLLLKGEDIKEHE